MAESKKSCGSGCCCSSPRAEMRLDEMTLEQVGALPTDDLIRRFSVGVEWLDPRLFHLSDEQLDQPFLPDAGCGRWSLRALAAHLADAEMVLLMRIRSTVAQDRPTLAIFDEEDFLASDLYGPGARAGSKITAPVAGSLALIHTLRRWAIDWLADLTEDQFARVALHPERGEVAARTWLAYATWHLEHHAAIANRKVERILGPMGAESEKQGCCGDDCACSAERAEQGGSVEGRD
ncbi:MAG: DinB family protein [Phycisphaerales bacterium JB039]